MGKKFPTDGEQYAKRNISAYMWFMKEKRDEIAKQYNVSGVGPVGKKIGEVWNGMSDAEKKPFQDMAAKDKARFEKELASGMQRAPNKSKKKKKGAEDDGEDDGEGKGKKAKKAKKKKDPNAPKKAPTPFFIFLAEERPKLKAQGLTKPAEVATKASEMWKDCSPRRKKRIEGEAEKAKAEYQAAKKAYDAKQAKAGGSTPKAAVVKKGSKEFTRKNSKDK